MPILTIREISHWPMQKASVDLFMRPLPLVPCVTLCCVTVPISRCSRHMPILTIREISHWPMQKASVDLFMRLLPLVPCVTLCCVTVPISRCSRQNGETGRPEEMGRQSLCRLIPWKMHWGLFSFLLSAAMIRAGRVCAGLYHGRCIGGYSAFC